MSDVPTLTEAALVLAAALFGLLIGSFVNVVVWRVPRGESVASPPSACPRCGRRIRARDNVPVLSWALLRGQCRDCSAPISARYPLVEAGTALVFGLVAAYFGWSWALPAFLYLAAVGVALGLIDIDVQRLPDAIVLPSYPVLLLLLTLASWNPGGEADWAALVRAVLGGALLFVLYFAMLVAYPAGMGFGDVKLAGLVGIALAWLGWGPFAVGAFAAFLLGGVYSVALVVTGRANRRMGIPFGPWMILGMALGVAVGAEVWDAYIALVL